MTTRHGELCTLLQQIGLPAVRVKLVGSEVTEYNELFSSLVNVVAPLDYRLWFVDGVLPQVSAPDRTRWEAAFTARTPVQVHVAFKSVDGRTLDFEMRSVASFGQKKFSRSILCVFIPLTNQIFAPVCDAHLSEGRELERCRIRNELHQGVSQQLLGAAFGCKLLAGKVGTLSEELGKEASYLADLVNEAVMKLQKLVHSTQDKT